MRIVHSKENNIELIKLLITMGIEINAIDEDNHNALYWAVYGNREDAIKLLIEKGININQISHRGWIPLMYYLTKENINKDIVRLLVNKDTDLNLEIKGKTISEYLKDLNIQIK